MLQRNSKDIVEHISQIIKEKHFKDKHSLEKGIEEASKNFVFRLCFMSSFGITKRVSNSIGFDRLHNTFNRALEAQPYNSIKLIDLAIKLGYSSLASNIEQVETYKDEMKKNKLSNVVFKILSLITCTCLIRIIKQEVEFVINLGISVQEQLKIDQTSTVKEKEIIPHTT